MTEQSQTTAAYRLRALADWHEQAGTALPPHEMRALAAELDKVTAPPPAPMPAQPLGSRARKALARKIKARYYARGIHANETGLSATIESAIDVFEAEAAQSGPSSRDEGVSLDALEDPEGAPYPEAAQIFVALHQPLQEPWGEAFRQDMVAALESVATSRDETAALRLAQALTHMLIMGDCEVTGFSGSGRCIEPATSVRWEAGFADLVCDEHASRAAGRGALVVKAARQDGTHRAALAATQDGEGT